MSRSTLVAAALREASSDQTLHAITIDFWDTLVERSASPWQVRRRVCAWAVAEWALGVSAADLHRLYDDVAEGLAIAATQIGLDYEYRASTAWMAVLRECMGEDQRLGEFAEALAQEEIVQNVRATSVAPDVVAALRNLDVLPFAVVSDNEMSPDQLGSIAREHGLELPRIFVSSEQGLTKRSGRLFHHVLEALELSSDRVMHIGDDDVGDRQTPRRLGMKLPATRIPSAVHSEQASTKRHAEPAKTFSQPGPEALGRTVANFVLFVEREISVVGADRVVFLGSEGSFFSEFFSSRSQGDDVIYQVVNLGRRHFLGAALARDPDWVIQRCLVSGTSLTSIGAIVADPYGNRTDVADYASAARPVIESFWRTGWVDPESMPLPAHEYDSVALARSAELGASAGESSLLVVDVGYRATSARAIGALVKCRVSSVGMFGEARYLEGRPNRMVSWLGVDAELVATGGSSASIPRVLLPLEVLLASGPRAPRHDARLAKFQRSIVASAHQHLREGLELTQKARAADADSWTALVVQPSRGLARSIFEAIHEDDLQRDSAGGGGWRPRLLDDRKRWRQGVTAVLTPVGASLLDWSVSAVVSLRRRFRSVGR